MTVKERVDRISRNKDLTCNQLPTSAKIELCGCCTLRCKFCYSTEMKACGQRQSIMSNQMFDDVMQFIQSIPSLKEVGLFYMGESALDPQLANRYKHIKELGYFTYLTTNGTIRDTIVQAIPYVDSLKVSWNYKNAQDFIDKTRSTKEMYDKIISNIEVFKEECNKHGKELTVSTIVDTCKEDYLDVLQKLSFDQHYWLPLQTQYSVNEGAVGSVVGQYDNQQSQIPCWSLFKCLYIDVDGNVRQCCYGHTNEHILYNIVDVKTFYIPDHLVELRRMQLEGKIPPICQKCQ